MFVAEASALVFTLYAVREDSSSILLSLPRLALSIEDVRIDTSERTMTDK